MSGGGILFGILLAVPLLPVSRHFARGSVAWLILFMTVTLAFGKNGILLLQSVVTGHGDPESVLIYGQIAYGIPPLVTRILFALAAIPILWQFGKLMLQLLRTYGPAREESYARWVTTILVAFMSYFVLMTVHTAVFGDRDLLMRKILPMYIPFMLLFAFLVLAVATWVYQTAGNMREAPTAAVQLTWVNSAVLFLLACMVIGSELVFLKSH